MFIQENQKRGIIVLRMARKRLVPTAVGPKKAVKYFWRTLSGFFLASPKLYTVPEKKDFLPFFIVLEYQRIKSLCADE
jgi:hypothetical protein